MEINLSNHVADDRYATYSPSGEQIVFESNRNGNWDIFVMDIDGKNLNQITTSTYDDRRPDWHPSGKRILFESDRDGRFALYELYIEKGSVSRITKEGLKTTPIFGRYSPNGKHIAYSTISSEDESEIIIANKKGDKSKALIRNGFRNYYPRWSPDGKSILFFSRHETDNLNDEIYSISINGTGIKRLTYWPKHNFCPAWSSDGLYIAYAVSMENSRPEIYMMDASGKNTIRLTNNEDGDTLPNWSPDSKHILITGYRNGNYEILKIPVPTSGR